MCFPSPHRSQSRGFFLVLLLLLVMCCLHSAASQRIKTGCYDNNPAAFASCRHEEPSLDDYNALSERFNVEGICLQLVTEVFPDDEKVIWDSSLHAQYLNDIDAKTELCKQIQQAYGHCLFCATSWETRFNCQDDSQVTQCGGKPSREEIIRDNATYAQFDSEADIDKTCNALQKAYQTVWIKDYGYAVPTTLELCSKQRLIKHVCPGFCNGTCFDAVEYPPTCDPDAYQGPVDPTLDAFSVCDDVNYQVFYKVDIGDIMSNISNHLDYLRAIHKDDPLCNEAKQVYHECYWCSTDRCFDKDHPTSCEPPEEVDPTIDVQEVCRELTYAFDNVSFDDELNISAHKFFVPAGIPFCDEARQVYHKCFWCAPSDVPFEFCLPNTSCNSTVHLPEDFVSTTLETLGIATDTAFENQRKLDCDAIHNQWEKDWSDPFSLQACYEDIFLARLCPVQLCEADPAGKLRSNYLGATTVPQKRALIWVSRVSAMLSFFGATYILHDSLKDKESRSMTYNQLLVGMAIFDIVTAFAWVFATAPIDREEAPYIEGAIGNRATCRAQSFFIQLGFTSIFYDVSLALYYVLVIAYDWREFHLKRVRMYMHCFPVLLGLGLALGVIAKYHWIEYGCHILPPPEGDMWAALIFVVLPLGLSISAITSSMLVVYWQVRKKAQKSRKWTLGVGQASQLEQAVFWQCLFYVCAFYITWPILFSVYLASIDVNGPLGLTLVVAFVAPLQGFNNFLVYIRPKVRKDYPSGSQKRRGSSFRFSSSLLGMMSGKKSSKSHSESRQDGSTDSYHVDAMNPSAALALHTGKMQEGEASKELSLFGTYDKNAHCEQSLEAEIERQETKSHCDQGSHDMHPVNKGVIGDDAEDEAMKRSNLGNFDIGEFLKGAIPEEKR